MIRKVAIVEDGGAMLPKEFVEMALGLPKVLFAAFFADLIRNNRDSCSPHQQAMTLEPHGIRV